MSNTQRGGVRLGAGRKPIDPKLKKKAYKIYINEILKKDIESIGVGKNFSEKTIDLINFALQMRKDNLK